MESFYGLDLEAASIMSIYNPLNRSQSPGYKGAWEAQSVFSSRGTRRWF